MADNRWPSVRTPSWSEIIIHECCIVVILSVNVSAANFPKSQTSSSAVWKSNKPHCFGAGWINGLKRGFWWHDEAPNRSVISPGSLVTITNWTLKRTLRFCPAALSGQKKRPGHDSVVPLWTPECSRRCHVPLWGKVASPSLWVSETLLVCLRQKKRDFNHFVNFVGNQTQSRFLSINTPVGTNVAGDDCFFLLCLEIAEHVNTPTTCHVGYFVSP